MYGSQWLIWDQLSNQSVVYQTEAMKHSAAVIQSTHGWNHFSFPILGMFQVIRCLDHLKSHISIFFENLRGGGGGRNCIALWKLCWLDNVFPFHTARLKSASTIHPGEKKELEGIWDCSRASNSFACLLAVYGGSYREQVGNGYLHA